MPILGDLHGLADRGRLREHENVKAEFEGKGCEVVCLCGQMGVRALADDTESGLPTRPVVSDMLIPSSRTSLVLSRALCGLPLMSEDTDSPVSICGPMMRPTLMLLVAERGGSGNAAAKSESLPAFLEGLLHDGNRQLDTDDDALA